MPKKNLRYNNLIIKHVFMNEKVKRVKSSYNYQILFKIYVGSTNPVTINHFPPQLTTILHLFTKTHSQSVIKS